MKNKHLHFLLLFATTSLFAQVGINTNDPKASLDVMANNTLINQPEGIIAPRLTGTVLKEKDNSYTDLQTGAIVYITEALSALDLSPKTTNVTAIGYYYFDGSVWQSMKASTPVDTKWDLNGNTITDGQFLGTLNAKALQFKYDNANAGFLNDLNTSYGYNALPITALGTDNAAFGKNVLSANTSGTNNTAIGNNALVNNTTGANNTAIGLNALRANTTFRDNVAIGTYALQDNTANNNVAIGSGAMTSNTVGNLNVAIGKSALAANTKTNSNTAIGAVALTNNIGASNTAIGNNALNLNTTGTNNTAIGSGAGSNQITGTSNTYIGRSANMVSVVAPATLTLSFATAIGADAIVGANSSIILGRTGNNGNLDKVGIGVTAPVNALHIKSSTNPLRVEGVQAATTSLPVLVIADDGTVYKAAGTVAAKGSITNDTSALKTMIDQQALQIKLLTEKVETLTQKVNALK